MPLLFLSLSLFLSQISISPIPSLSSLSQFSKNKIPSCILAPPMSSEQNPNPKPSSSPRFSLLASDHDRSSFSIVARVSRGSEGIRSKGEERMGKVSVVVFDMDDVLCNNEESSRMAAVDVFAEMEVLVTIEDFIPFMGTGSVKDIDRR